MKKFCLPKPVRFLPSLRRAFWLSALLLLPLVTQPLFAQQAQPFSYSGLDGQQVSDVEVAAGPKVDVTAMRKLIRLHAHEGFSAEAMRQSVEALQKTRRFSQVQVSLVPEKNGLRVLFILQPAFYVGVLQFPGTGRRFPYTALMQATDIPEQSPYFENLLTTGKQGLLTYFQQHGYFEAEVQPEVQLDDSHRIANVIFRCTMKSRARLREITFSGLSEPQSAAMLARLHGLWARLKRVTLKPGQKYSQSRIEKSSGFIRAHLREDDRLPPSVRLASSKFDPDSNRVDITLDVIPGPKVSVRMEGAHVSGKTLRRLIPIYEEGSVDQDLVDEGGRNLSAYFQTKGYFDAKTDSRIEKENGVVTVVYNVDKGTKHRLEGAYFSGNHHFSDRQLNASVSIRKGFLFLRGKYSRQLLTKSVNSLKQLYKDRGFQNVSIQTKVEDFNPAVDVTFEISEGPRDKVSTVQVIGNKTQPLPALTRRHALHLKPGALFSEKLLQADRSDLLAAYLNRGYLNANVRATAVASSE